MAKMIGLIIVWVVGGAIFLGILMSGINDRWGSGGHPVIVAGVLILVCLVISILWGMHKGEDEKEEIKDNY